MLAGTGIILGPGPVERSGTGAAETGVLTYGAARSSMPWRIPRAIALVSWSWRMDLQHAVVKRGNPASIPKAIPPNWSSSLMNPNGASTGSGIWAAIPPAMSGKGTPTFVATA